MSTTLRITNLDVTSIQHDCWIVKVILHNAGTQRLASGHIVAKQTTRDGTVRTVEFFNSADLAPGQKAKLSQLLRGILKEIDFKIYRTSDGVAIPVSGMARRGLFRWSLAAA